MIPGKLIQSHRVAYVAWGGVEHAKSEYEVLINCRPQWIRSQGNSIPPQAIPAGEASGEKLFGKHIVTYKRNNV